MTARAIAARPAPWPDAAADWASSTALLIIDMQQDFCHPQGYAAQQGYDVSPMATLVPRIAAVRDALAGMGCTIIHTREGHRPDLSDLPPHKRQRSARGGAEIGTPGPLGKLLIRGEPGWAIVAELTPQAGEIVIDKPGYSAFHATDLAQILTTREIRRLIVTGVTTDVCVHSTLRQAIDMGFECLLIEDCCAATEPHRHEAAVETILSEGGIFGSVTNSAAVLQAARAASADAPARRTAAG